jgi:hypothetical protein
MSVTRLLDRLWENYRATNPQAGRIHALLSARGETVVNDHVAFRTFDHPAVGIAALAPPFLAAGYVQGGTYDFPDKHLRAVHLEHRDPALPKVFLSELLTAKLPPGLQSVVAALINQIPPAFLSDPDLCAAGRPWNLSRWEYEALGRVSEYAAWLSAFGFCANHFTVLANSLHTFASLPELNAFLKGAGFVLNTDGGEIKGSAAAFLEQSSTLAAPVRAEFSDGMLEIPGCYYEFALSVVSR